MQVINLNDFNIPICAIKPIITGKCTLQNIASRKPSILLGILQKLLQFEEVKSTMETPNIKPPSWWPKHQQYKLDFKDLKHKMNDSRWNRFILHAITCCVKHYKAKPFDVDGFLMRKSVFVSILKRESRKSKGDCVETARRLSQKLHAVLLKRKNRLRMKKSPDVAKKFLNYFPIVKQAEVMTKNENKGIITNESKSSKEKDAVIKSSLSKQKEGEIKREINEEILGGKGESELLKLDDFDNGNKTIYLRINRNLKRESTNLKRRKIRITTKSNIKRSNSIINQNLQVKHKRLRITRALFKTNHNLRVDVSKMKTFRRAKESALIKMNQSKVKSESNSDSNLLPKQNIAIKQESNVLKGKRDSTIKSLTKNKSYIRKDPNGINCLHKRQKLRIKMVSNISRNFCENRKMKFYTGNNAQIKIDFKNLGIKPQLGNQSKLALNKFQNRKETKAGISKSHIREETKLCLNKSQIEKETRAYLNKSQIEEKTKSYLNKSPIKKETIASPNKPQIEREAEARLNKLNMEEKTKARLNKSQIEKETKVYLNKSQIKEETKAYLNKLQIEKETKTGQNKSQIEEVRKLRQNKLQIEKQRKPFLNKIEEETEASLNKSQIVKETKAILNNSKNGKKIKKIKTNESHIENESNNSNFAIRDIYRKKLVSKVLKRETCRRKLLKNNTYKTECVISGISSGTNALENKGAGMKAESNSFRNEELSGKRKYNLSNKRRYAIKRKCNLLNEMKYDVNNLWNSGEFRKMCKINRTKEKISTNIIKDVISTNVPKERSINVLKDRIPRNLLKDRISMNLINNRISTYLTKNRLSTNLTKNCISANSIKNRKSIFNRRDAFKIDGNKIKRNLQNKKITRICGRSSLLKNEKSFVTKAKQFGNRQIVIKLTNIIKPTIKTLKIKHAYIKLNNILEPRAVNEITQENFMHCLNLAPKESISDLAKLNRTYPKQNLIKKYNAKIPFSSELGKNFAFPQYSPQIFKRRSERIDYYMSNSYSKYKNEQLYDVTYSKKPGFERVYKFPEKRYGSRRKMIDTLERIFCKPVSVRLSRMDVDKYFLNKYNFRECSVVLNPLRFYVDFNENGK